MENNVYAIFDKKTKAFIMTKSMPPIKNVSLEGYEADKDSQDKDTNKKTLAEEEPGGIAEDSADNQLTGELARAKMSAEPVCAEGEPTITAALGSQPTKKLGEQTLSADTLLSECSVNVTTKQEDNLHGASNAVIKGEPQTGKSSDQQNQN